MKKFKEIKKTGDGTFGVVVKAQDMQSYELVAIKKMKQKYHNFEECTNLREVKALMKLQNHVNIVKLKEIFLDGDTLCMVFEFVEKSIYQMYTQYKDQGKTIPEDQIKSLIYQCANGLAYMHKHGYFHRDLKPENLLVTNNGILKIIDLGLAREIRSRPPYTDYVATRWYRGPEILLKQLNYNSPVDIFALGCIMAELFLNRPLFQGNSELEQFNKILSILGTFTAQDWPEGCRLVSQMGMTLAQFQGIPLQQLIPNASNEALNLISQMIKWDPYKRITAQQILTHPYFYNIQQIVPALVFEEQPKQQDQQVKNIEQPKQEQPKQKELVRNNNNFQASQKQIKNYQRDNSSDLDDIIDMLAENNPLPTKNNTQSAKQLEYGDYVPSTLQQRQQRNNQQQQSQSQKKESSNSIYDFDYLQFNRPEGKVKQNQKY